jgi:hypothetical protein
MRLDCSLDLSKSMISSFIYLCAVIFEKTHLDLITCQKTHCLMSHRQNLLLRPLGGAKRKQKWLVLGRPNYDMHNV